MQVPVGQQMMDERREMGQAPGWTTVADAPKSQTLTHSELEPTAVTREPSKDLVKLHSEKKAEKPLLHQRIVLQEMQLPNWGPNMQVSVRKATGEAEQMIPPLQKEA
ncbi:hypothetical protein NDU88_008605 [Pleurodeles waltl]|uniref:Uncharacterized protein n=1 Tax=Pleurodeles waltl TaxID=8319 RepID=A0AAV7RV41_PLEWA|nr:hypothetical protein NDU88_008605 [Pleurodeles waltl]